MRIGRDGIAGLIGLAVSLGLLPSALALPKLPIVPVGPGFYAVIVLVFLAGTSAILLVQDVVAHKASVPPSPEAPPAGRPAYGLVLSAFAVVGAYATLLPYLGFRISTFLFVAAFQALLDPPRSVRQWALLLSVAGLAAGLSYALFEQYLSVLLPRGRWTDF